MVRTTASIAVVVAFTMTAAAQDVPELDIRAHCADVGGGNDRVTACIANETSARLWLKSHKIDQRILYHCTQSLDLMKAGYVLLQACVQAKRRAQ